MTNPTTTPARERRTCQVCDRDPRGPERKITKVEYTSSAALVTLDYGHTREFNATFTYRIGDRARCFACRQEAR